MKRYVFIFVLSIFFSALYGQGNTRILQGKVSFLSSQNVYVRFQSTQGISVGDTLFGSGPELVAMLLVNNLSSTSCVCTNLSGISVAVNDVFVAKVSEKAKSESKNETKEEVERQVISSDSSRSETKAVPKENELKQRIRGSLSAYSYSDFSSSAAANSQRFRYTLSLDARNINNSRFSAETYISFRHKKGDWSEVQTDIFNALKIYSLAVKYQPDKNSSIILGRKINPKISSIGAIDGLQLEKTINKFTFGAVAGSRPDYRNYGIDPLLLQFGAYTAFNHKNTKTWSESSLAFMQQMNSGNTDRRFLYFQHSNSLLKDLNFFGTFEVDLFELKNNVPVSTFSPTGVYASLRYKLSKKISFSGSYDARKNVIYYETYKTTIDSLFESELRQGFRLQGNYRITRSLMFGITSGYRFLKSDPHPSKNLYSYLSYSQIPGIGISATLSASYLESAYLSGKILGLNITRDFWEGKIQTGAGYRYINYKLPENLIDLKQNIAELNISWQFLNKMSFSANYEGTFEPDTKYNRLYLQLRMRF
ncbi:MAG: hypothetical protein H6538_08270 [Bacteroidales bacterium]|nr:hypothetical protein [Bacteroidales bacterium]